MYFIVIYIFRLEKSNLISAKEIFTHSFISSKNKFRIVKKEKYKFRIYYEQNISQNISF
jgi:hypothetical protein